MKELLSKVFKKDPNIPTISESFTLSEQLVLNYFGIMRGINDVSGVWAEMNHARLNRGQSLLELQEYIMTLDVLQERGFLEFGCDGQIRVAEITERGKQAAKAVRKNRGSFWGAVEVQVPNPVI